MRGWGAVLLVLLLVPRAQANVYATNIRLNGSLTNVTVSGSVTISYTLNEPASAGLILEIKSGLNTLRTFHMRTPTVAASSWVGMQT